MRRETGREQRVRVPHDEDMASHNVPESCVSSREARGEALTGVCIGQPLSRDSPVPGADIVQVVEGNTRGCDIASARSARRGRRTWHVHKLSVREPGDLRLDHARRYGWVARVGKARSRSQR